MSEDLKNNIRLAKAAKEFNIGMSTITEFLTKKGFKIDSSPNTKLSGEMYALLLKEYQGEKEVKKNADKFGELTYKGKSISVESKPTIEDEEDDNERELSIRITGSIPEEKISKKPATEFKISAKPTNEVNTDEIKITTDVMPKTIENNTIEIEDKTIEDKTTIVEDKQPQPKEDKVDIQKVEEETKDKEKELI